MIKVLKTCICFWPTVLQACIPLTVLWFLSAVCLEGKAEEKLAPTSLRRSPYCLALLSLHGLVTLFLISATATAFILHFFCLYQFSFHYVYIKRVVLHNGIRYSGLNLFVPFPHSKPCMLEPSSNTVHRVHVYQFNCVSLPAIGHPELKAFRTLSFKTRSLGSLKLDHSP